MSTAQEGRPQDYPQQALSASTATTTKRKGDKSEVIDLLHDMQSDRDNKNTKDAHWREKENLHLEKE